jgi:Protein of unknown function (DUF3237)
MAIELAYEFTYEAVLAEKVPIGDGPYGNRRVREVTGGKVSGERINGVVGSGGGDWILVGPDGWGRLDVRLQIHTDDGADIYVQYYGVVEYNEASIGANEGKGSSDYGDQYFRTAPRLETGDPRYEWVNRSLFVGEGRLHPGPVVEYRVYRVL